MTPKLLRPLYLTVSAQFLSLADMVTPLWDRRVDDTTPLTVPIPTATPTNPLALVLLSSMSMEEIVLLVHHDSSALLPVPPCDMANESDSKTHWMAEEIHRVRGAGNSGITGTSY
jgi:hypothetical protein